MQRTAIKTIQKAGKCCICKASTTQRYGLKWACSIDHAIEFSNRAIARKKAKELNEVKKKHRADKAHIKTLKTLCAEARTIVQKYARLRDAPYGTCICCGKAKIEDGAHYHAVGSKYQCSRISLNPDQIFGACARCNRFVGGGNRAGFDIGLTQRYGPNKLAELAELKRKADSGEDLPLTKDDVKTIKAHYSALTRALIKNHAA